MGKPQWYECAEISIFKASADTIESRTDTEEAIKLKPGFLATASHDLRAHVNSLISLTGFLLDGKLIAP
jgi:hypothetical protein